MSVATMTTSDALATLAEHISQLTKNHQHVERYFVWTPSRHKRWRQHLTWHPPLLVQLRRATHPHGADEALGGRHGKPAPAAPANLDALDRMQAITTAVASWRERLGLGTVSRGRLEDDMQSLVGMAPTVDAEVRAALVEDIDRWRLWCLTLAGWRTPPWRPNAACPLCNLLPGDRAGLRVRLDQSTACCVSCGAVWSPDTVGVLAEHVRHWKEESP